MGRAPTRHAAAPHPDSARRALGLFVQSMEGPLGALLAASDPRDVGLAATRFVLRIVVVLFAEARGLLPGAAARFSDLCDALEREGEDVLVRRARAYGRVLEVFRQMHATLRGEGLFAPGQVDAADPVERILARFEDPPRAPSDRDVLRILRCFCRCPARVRRGSRARSVEEHVDFASLSPSFIGVLYEGICDFELVRASEDGAFSLVRASGKRKGSGTFYTPPELAGPAVQRTLFPLAYRPPLRSDGTEDRGAPCAGWSPRRPEEILSLAICDPAMGSGSFLVAALRFLTEALSASVRHHGPGLDPEGAPTLGGRVLGRCLYGVDLDPMAVELGRLALHVEAGDRTFPFESLRRKLAVGNSLVGCWSDRFRSYPALAWMREGGDRKHEGGVHHERGTWTNAIAALRGGRVKEELASARQEDKPLASATREAFDAWCAVWFWPSDRLGDAPMPQTFARPSAATRELVAKLAAEIGFFHWELAFPEVFSRERAGFDAIVGNPPWEIQKPSSLEFFSNIDPAYRTYTKAEAKRRQREIFAASRARERAWIEYNGRQKALSNWVKHAGAPLGGSAEVPRPFRHQGSADVNTYKLFLELSLALLREGGALGMVVPSGIYADLGARDLRALFLERCRWDFLYVFQNERFVFENVDHRFKAVLVCVEKGGRTAAVSARFRLGPGDSPERAELARDIARGAPAVSISVETIARLSPGTNALLEVRGERDLSILEALHRGGAALGEGGAAGLGARYVREFDMTNDADRFTTLADARSSGFVADTHGRLVHADGRVLLPLLQGVMVGCMESNRARWIAGKGSQASWDKATTPGEPFSPQFVVSSEIARAEHPTSLRGRLGFRAIGRTTDERTLIGTYLPPFPTGNSLSCLVTPGGTIDDELWLCAAMSSFVFDWAIRMRLGGANLNWAFVAEAPVPRRGRAASRVACLSARLALPGSYFAPAWLELAAIHPSLREVGWRRLWAVTPHERVRLRAMLDAIVAAQYGLDEPDLRWLLRDCDLPTGALSAKSSNRALDPKGFWRVDRDQDPELRHTVLTLVAFRELMEAIAERGDDRDAGIEAFCAKNGGEGFLLPGALCLAEYGLGRDERARALQPVAARLGERFARFQLEPSVRGSWDECALSAEELLRFGHDAPHRR